MDRSVGDTDLISELSTAACTYPTETEETTKAKDLANKELRSFVVDCLNQKDWKTTFAEGKLLF